MSALPSDSELDGSISIDQFGDVTVVRLIGDHDICTAAQLRAELDASTVAGGLVVSLVETTFLDSSVVHALLAADRRMTERKRSLVIQVATPSIVERVLELSGIKQKVRCTPSFEEAVAAAAEVEVETVEWSTP